MYHASSTVVGLDYTYTYTHSVQTRSEFENLSPEKILEQVDDVTLLGNTPCMYHTISYERMGFVCECKQPLFLFIIEDMTASMHDNNIIKCITFALTFSSYLLSHKHLNVMLFITDEDDDCGAVMEYLTTVAGHWQAISRSLHVKASKIDEFSNSFGHDPARCLGSAITDWLRWNYNHTEFGKPTWRKVAESVVTVNKKLFLKIALEHTVKGNLKLNSPMIVEWTRGFPV